MAKVNKRRYLAKRCRAGVNARLPAVLLWSGLALVWGGEPAFAQRTLYRYQTEDGMIIQGDRLPADAAARGYAVLNAAGDVLELVPRQLNEQERTQRSIDLEREQAEEQELERVRSRDRTLILRYSSVEDIDEAMARGLLKYDTRIGILRGNLLSLKSQIERQQNNAANYLRRGREVPDALTRRVADLKGEVVYAENAIMALRHERADSELQFHSDKERFAYLMRQASLAR